MTGVPGEDAVGVETGVDFLRRVNLNEEGVKLSGKTVVIGGGNVAVDVARTALRTGSSDVSMFCLESRDIMPAADDWLNWTEGQETPQDLRDIYIQFLEERIKHSELFVNEAQHARKALI